MSKFYTRGVAFDELKPVLQIYRRMERSKEDVLSFFTDEENRKFIETNYEKIQPITAKEALSFANAEQRMVAARSISPGELVEEIGAELINKQTISKKQIRWDQENKPYQHEFEDTYELYKINVEKLAVSTNRWVRPAIYMVKCSCTTTGRVYYLYVHEDAAREGDAITAIAWTYRYNGIPLTKHQYLNLIYTET
jgi:hypothetical protein